MKQTRRWIIVLPLLAGLCPGCDLNWGGTKPDGSGTIECTQVQVAPQVAGRIVSLPFQEGDAVAKGAVVARLDSTDYELKREEAQAALAQAQAQLELTIVGSRDEDIQRERERLREAQVTARAAETDLTRIKAVSDRGSATQKQLDDAKAAAERAAAAAAGVEQSLARLLKGNRKEEIRAAQAQADQAKARLAQMERAIAYCTVAAPMDGVVTTRNREEGEVVGVGTTLATLSRLDEVWLSVYVPETRLCRVKLGRPAIVRIDGSDRAYEGTVIFVSPEAEFTPRNVQTPEDRAKLVYRVKISLKNSEGVFKPGMPADGYLEEAK